MLPAAKGANVNLQIQWGKYLMWAVHRGCGEAAYGLQLKAGAEVNLKTEVATRFHDW